MGASAPYADQRSKIPWGLVYASVWEIRTFSDWESLYTV